MLSERDYIDTLKEGNGNLVARVHLKNLDFYRTLTPKLSFYKRVYKRLFPIRFHVNEYYKAYYLRTHIFDMVNRFDKFIAWGDTMEVNRREIS